MLYEHELPILWEEHIFPESHPVKTPTHDLSIAGFPLLLKWGFNPDMLNEFESSYQAYAVQTRTQLLSLTDTLSKIEANSFDHTPRSLTKQYETALKQTTREWETILNTFYLTAKTLLPPFTPEEIAERKQLTDNPFFCICPKETLLLFATDYLRTLVDTFTGFRKKEDEYKLSKKTYLFMEAFPDSFPDNGYDQELRVACRKMKMMKKEVDRINKKMKVLAAPVLEESDRLKKEKREEAKREKKREKERRKMEEERERMKEESRMEVESRQEEKKKKAGLGVMGLVVGWFSGKNSAG